MINISSLRKQVLLMLKADLIFNRKVNEILGANLNYYLGTNENRTSEDLPAIVFLTDVATDPNGDDLTYPILFNIQIVGSQVAVTQDGMSSFVDEEKVNEIAVAAEDAIRDFAPCIKIGENAPEFFPSDTTMAIAPLMDSMIQTDESQFLLDDDGNIINDQQIGYMAAVEIVISQVKHLNRQIRS